MKQNVYFVSGIDTDAGKSYATGFLAREWNKTTYHHSKIHPDRKRRPFRGY